MKLTKFGKFLGNIFDNHQIMSEEEETQLHMDLFMRNGMSLKQLDNMSLKDIDKMNKNKRCKN